MASTTRKVAIISGSTRSPRVGPSVAEFVQNVLKAAPSYSSAEFTIVDVADFKLPVFDEKVLPAMVPAYGQFEHEHTKRWSTTIASFDAYIFISPEYNYGIPGGAKNAIDYLYNDWIGKPIMIVTYGILGGSSASFSLKRTLEGMKLRVVETRPKLVFPGGGFGAECQGAVGGTLGEESKKLWAENTDLGKGFEQLVELLNDPEKKGTEATFDPAFYVNN